MIATLLIALALAAPLPGQDAEASQGPPERVRSILLFGDEACPPPVDPEEIVVCAEMGDSPYRIPKQFRAAPAEGPEGQAWGRRAEMVEEVNRIGLPNSCSPVGSGGQTGCTRAMIRQWAQERIERRAKEGRQAP